MNPDAPTLTDLHARELATLLQSLFADLLRQTDNLSLPDQLTPERQQAAHLAIAASDLYDYLAHDLDCYAH